jgi:serine/threonine-protein kinase
LPQTFFLGRYRVVDEIGVGGMASVHLARVDGPGGFQKWVAIKRIHPHLVEDDQFVDMFLDEARIAAGINHANVAQVFDLGKDENTYWIAMEYLHGEPLRELMRSVEEQQVTIPPHIAARICADAAEGLHGAHELRGRNGQLLNLVHRDVTPHNLFVTYEGYTKVVDFGIAKVVDRLASTRAGTLKGKLAYMSPEQVRGQEVDRRTDIFALGVVLWELTTNRRLFRMDTDLDTLEKVQACVVPLPSSIMPGYPAELEAVVMKALAQRKEERFQTAREFSRALQRYLMTTGIFVGPEDVGEYCKTLFNDRVSKREKYLEWAAEVTSTVDVEQLRAQQASGDAQSLLTDAVPQSQVKRSAPVPSHRSSGQNSAAAAVVTSAPALQAPPQPAQPAQQSYMDDEDEDIPTRVAMRDEELMSQLNGGQQNWDLGATQVAPGMPAEDDMQSTIALPDGRQAEQIRAQLDAADAARQQAGMQQQPQQGGHAGMQQQHPGMSGMTPEQEARIKQAAIETKMSMPRPAAVAQFLAEQGDIQIQGPRSTGVLMAIALLSTLCVIGVAALVVYKVRTPPVSLDMVAAAPQQPNGQPIAANAGDGVDQGGAADGDATGATPVATSKSSKTTVRRTTPRKSTKSSKDPEKEPDAKDKKATVAKEPPGSLTIDCSPACDSVVAGGRSLGPSPIFSHPMPPGQHRVTLKRKGGPTKTISVIITSGQLTSQRVSMK